MNSFQKYMLSDSSNELVKNIVQLYHPELNVSELHFEVRPGWKVYTQNFEIAVSANGNSIEFA